jgi:amino acid transporter/nucleotide-binding universal stress UspA family protein
MARPGAPATEQVEVTLTRDLKLLDITMIGVGAMIGAGIFALTGEAARTAGPSLLLAFFLNGFVTLFSAAAYAELGSSFPEAGGGYLWVKEGMTPLFGFLSGWMSWFAHAVACSLYSLAFGEFSVNLLVRAGILPPGSNDTWFPVLIAVSVAGLFSYVNLRGSSETGMVGNIVTIAKVIILTIFAIIGMMAIQNMSNWQGQLDPFMHPTNGIGGVFLAMGLTFIAFEGYEIIAQSGEEVIDPKRNIPRAIFLSIIIVVTIYLAVGFVAITAVQPADGRPTWMFLGGTECSEVPAGTCPEGYITPVEGELGELEPELAIINAAESFMGSWGSILLLFGGLMSAMSALNATIYSSSRVSFAMGRDLVLPEIFGHIHRRFHTPHWAIGISAILIIGMDIVLLGNIKNVATSADIMFLLLFLMVNFSVITLRKRRPDLERGFRVPFVPWVPIVGIVLQLALAINLLNLSVTAWIVAVIWIAVGVVYYLGSAPQRTREREEVRVVHQEIVAVADYSVLVPVADIEQAGKLGTLGTALAGARNGELFAVHVVGVPQALSLADGRYFLKQGIPILQRAIEAGQAQDVPVNTMLRLGRDVGSAILETARERRSDLILLGWPGYTRSERAAFGKVIDLVSQAPPCDIAVVRFRSPEAPKRMLIPTAGGPNTGLCLELAIAQAQAFKKETGEDSEITVMTVITPSNDRYAMESLHNRYRQIYGYNFKSLFIQNGTVLDAILDESENHNLVLIGATEEGLFERKLFGTMAENLARESHKTVIMCKAHDRVRHLFNRMLTT